MRRITQSRGHAFRCSAAAIRRRSAACTSGRREITSAGVSNTRSASLSGNAPGSLVGAGSSGFSASGVDAVSRTRRYARRFRQLARVWRSAPESCAALRRCAPDRAGWHALVEAGLGDADRFLLRLRISQRAARSAPDAGGTRGSLRMTSAIKVRRTAVAIRLHGARCASAAPSSGSRSPEQIDLPTPVGGSAGVLQHPADRGASEPAAAGAIAIHRAVHLWRPDSPAHATTLSPHLSHARLRDHADRDCVAERDRPAGRWSYRRTLSTTSTPAASASGRRALLVEPRRLQVIGQLLHRRAAGSQHRERDKNTAQMSLETTCGRSSRELRLRQLGRRLGLRLRVVFLWNTRSSAR